MLFKNRRDFQTHSTFKGSAPVRLPVWTEDDRQELPAARVGRGLVCRPPRSGSGTSVQTIASSLLGASLRTSKSLLDCGGRNSEGSLPSRLRAKGD